MELLHSTEPSNKNILAILKDGFLRPGTETGKSGYGQSVDVYLRISTDIDYIDDLAQFYIDLQLLQTVQFFMRCSWGGCISENEIINVNYNITSNDLKKIMNAFKKLCIARHKAIYNRATIMSNEIIISANVDLHKYLRKVRISPGRGEKALIEYIKKNYPGVKIIVGII